MHNDQLAQTLLLQISTQLQALATLSPTTIQQIQFQILAATMTSTPAVTAAPQIPIPGVGTGTLLANFQLAAAGQLPVGLPAMLHANAGIHYLKLYI